MSDATPTSPQTPLPRPARPSVQAPGGSDRAQRWETIRLGIRLASVVILTAAIVGFLCLSGKPITVEQIILVIVAGGALAGLTAARGAGGGGGGAAAAGGVLLVLATVLGGCGAGAQVGQGSCIQAAVSAALEVLEGCSPRAQGGEACPVEREPPYVDEAP